jgi:hypothetical protein
MTQYHCLVRPAWAGHDRYQGLGQVLSIERMPLLDYIGAQFIDILTIYK